MRNVLLIAVLMGSAICSGQTSPRETTDTAQIETTYDSKTDRTTVRLAPVQISGEKDKYHSLHMNPSFSFAGTRPVSPSIIDFELQTVVKGRLNSDLYVIFIIDGEAVFLSSNRWAIRRPVPGRIWMGESLVFRMPLETFVKLANSKQAAVKMGGTLFEFTGAHRSALRALAEKIN